MLKFIVSLFFIILFHEGAHLIIAKLCKCGVEVFSIGFGKPIFKKKIGDTIYQFCPILLGGYNKLKDEIKCSKDPKAFSNLLYRKKFLIAIAGVTVNIIMGIICLIIGKNYHIYNLTYFGWLSLALGIGNTIPFPALDGSYPILVWLEKFYGKEKGYQIMSRICHLGFIILMLLNILCIPLLIGLIKIGGL
jgi:membrane-associated protease RseP (regulator of RpoE activity)